MNYLCLDYGEKHIGLAYSAGLLAEPLFTTPTSNAITIISKIIEQYAIDTLVIGISEGVMAQKTRNFANNLKQTTGLPIIFHDETLSSQETRIHIAQTGKRKKAREAKIDHIVAATILNDYLDAQPNNNL